MTPAERFDWSTEHSEYWDGWVICPACGYPAALDLDDYCLFCAYLPSDGYRLGSPDPNLNDARINVEKFDFSDPSLSEDNDEYWIEFCQRYRCPEKLERNAVFRADFEEMVSRHEGGQLRADQLSQQMRRIRNRLLAIQEDEAGPIPWENEPIDL